MYSIYLKNLFAQVQTNWFKLILAFLMVYVISVKDLSFQFSLNSAQLNSAVPMVKEQASASPVVYKMEKSNSPAKLRKEPIKTNQFSIWSFWPFGKIKAKPKKKQLAKEANTLDSIEEANDFSNLDFLFDTGLNQKNASAQEKLKNKRCQQYLRRFAPVAIAEMKKYGIPASITLAQALLESNAGESSLTKKNANHFGIKCFSKKCGKGHCTNFMDDGHKDFFRKYKSSWDSFRDHSLFLNKKRYRHLKTLGTDDYIGWARGLKQAGYATDKHYAEKLVNIIENFQLYKLDA